MTRRLLAGLVCPAPTLVVAPWNPAALMRTQALAACAADTATSLRPRLVWPVHVTLLAPASSPAILSSWVRTLCGSVEERVLSLRTKRGPAMRWNAPTAPDALDPPGTASATVSMPSGRVRSTRLPALARAGQPQAHRQQLRAGGGGGALGQQRASRQGGGRGPPHGRRAERPQVDHARGQRAERDAAADARRTGCQELAHRIVERDPAHADEQLRRLR